MLSVIFTKEFDSGAIWCAYLPFCQYCITLLTLDDSFMLYLLYLFGNHEKIGVCLAKPEGFLLVTYLLVLPGDISTVNKFNISKIDWCKYFQLINLIFY